ncbi:MAG: glutathione S-transferase family protein [Myxococcota bacterium]
MKLHIFPPSPNCRKVALVAAHLGLTADVDIVDLSKGAHKQGEFLAINPNGKVPALTDGTLKLWESNAICCHLASQYDNSLWPEASRIDVLRWMFWEAAHWSPALAPFTVENVIKGGKDVDQASLDAAADNVHRFGAVLNGAVEGREFVVGDGVTLADYVLAAPMMYQPIAKAPIDRFPHLVAWLDRVRATDAWKKTELK